MEVTQFKQRVMRHFLLQSTPQKNEFAEQISDKLLSFPPDLPESTIINAKDVSSRKVFIQIIGKYVGNGAKWPIEIGSRSAMDEIMNLYRRCKGQRARYVTMKNLFPTPEPSSMGTDDDDDELPHFDALAGDSNSRHHIESAYVSSSEPPTSTSRDHHETVPSMVTFRSTLRSMNLSVPSSHMTPHITPPPFSSPFAMTVSPTTRASMVVDDGASLLRSMVEALDLALDDVIGRLQKSFQKYKMTLVE